MPDFLGGIWGNFSTVVPFQIFSFFSSVLLFFPFIFILWKAWVCVDGADSGQQLFLSLYSSPNTPHSASFTTHTQDYVQRTSTYVVSTLYNVHFPFFKTLPLASGNKWQLWAYFCDFFQPWATVSRKVFSFF